MKTLLKKKKILRRINLIAALYSDQRAKWRNDIPRTEAQSQENYIKI